jgi:hypothetical protein
MLLVRQSEVRRCADVTIPSFLKHLRTSGKSSSPIDQWNLFEEL